MIASARRAFSRIERTFRSRSAYKFFVNDWTNRLPDLQSSANVIATMRVGRLFDPVLMDGPQGRKIAVLAAHPDDEILGCGGTIIRSIKSGRSVSVICLTSGKPQGQTEREANDVSSRLGYKVEFMRRPLGAIPNDMSTLEECARRIVATGADCLLVPFLLDDHDDHRRTSEILFRLFQGRLLGASEYEIWAYQVYSAVWSNVIVDITDVADKKAEAMRLYAGQMKTRDWAHYILGMNAYWSRFLRSTSAPRYVEAFFVVPASEYVSLCELYFRNPTSAYINPNYKI